jgi:hypothetical protein
MFKQKMNEMKQWRRFLRSYDDFPEDLLRVIFEFCVGSFRDLLHFSRINRTWKRLCDHSTFWLTHDLSFYPPIEYLRNYIDAHRGFVLYGPPGYCCALIKPLHIEVPQSFHYAHQWNIGLFENPLKYPQLLQICISRFHSPNSHPKVVRDWFVSIFIEYQRLFKSHIYWRGVLLAWKPFVVRTICTIMAVPVCSMILSNYFLYSYHQNKEIGQFFLFITHVFYLILLTIHVGFNYLEKHYLLYANTDLKYFPIRVVIFPFVCFYSFLLISYPHVFPSFLHCLFCPFTFRLYYMNPDKDLSRLFRSLSWALFIAFVLCALLLQVNHSTRFFVFTGMRLFPVFFWMTLPILIAGCLSPLILFIMTIHEFSSSEGGENSSSNSKNNLQTLTKEYIYLRCLSVMKGLIFAILLAVCHFTAFLLLFYDCQQEMILDLPTISLLTLSSLQDWAITMALERMIPRTKSHMGNDSKKNGQLEVLKGMGKTKVE